MSSLMFIYNAKSGMANALLDTGRRIFRPDQYACALCMVTYGPFGMKDDWKKFTNRLPYDMSFIHMDELPKDVRDMQLDFPCVLLKQAENSVVIISATEFEAIKDLSTLENKLIKKLQL